MRAIFEHMYDQPMHDSWRLRRGCPTRNCSIPAHWRLELVFRPDVEPKHLPTRIADLIAAPDDIEDVIDLILSIDDGRDMDTLTLFNRFMGAYDETLIAQALARIEDEGL